MKKIKNIASFILGSLLALAFIDLYVESTGIIRLSEMQIYKDIGKGYRSNHPYIWFSEGFSMGKFNRKRFLGPNYSKTKPSNVKRIALLGDSYIEGLQVFDRDHLRSRLEKHLNDNSLDSIQVLNFGRSNFNLGNMYAYEKLFVNQFDPDLIIYFVSTEDLCSIETDPLLPNVVNEHLDIAEVMDSSKMEAFNKANYLLQRFSFLYMVNSARKKAEQGMTGPIIFDKFYIEPQINYEPLLTPEIPERNLKILKEIDRNDVLLIYREKEAMPMSVLNSINDHHPDFIDLSPFLNSLEEEGINPNYWEASKMEGHWNPQAHQRISEQLSDKVIETLESLDSK